ncbi:MAG: FtsX-like permease family protein, partial [Chloroflexi bacterium]|nr:FtsX-like permease family protein [Chloroflexota bacterium]
DAGLNAESGDSLLDRIANRLRGLPESMALALRNTFRRKARLGLTLATLTLAGAIFVAVLSVRSSLFTDLDRALVYYGYDLSVDLGDSYRLQQIEREANRIGGIAAVEGWLTTGAARVRPDGSESSDYSVIGLPPDSIIVEPELVEGRWVQPGDRNAIVVNTDFLREETDVQLGDTLTLTLGEQEAEWEIVGIITKQYNGPILYAGIDDLGRELNRVGFANRALIALDNPTPQTEAVTAAAVEDRFQQAGILVGSTTTSSDFIETFSFRFNFLVIFLLALAVMLAFVGGLGLAGTMGLNVLERVREIGVMRAIGAPDGVVQRIILTEGIVIGAMSWVLAAALALPLSKALSAGVGLAFAGEPLTFTFSLMGALVWLVLVIVIAAVSSYLPARRAAQLSVRETLAYE